MTIADEIAERVRKEESQLTLENTNFNHFKALLKKSLEPNFIADAFKIPMQKIEEYIKRIKSSSN